MGAERWRRAAEPTANGEWRFARRRVRTDHGTGLGLHASVTVSSAQWRRRGPRTAGFSGASACAREPGMARATSCAGAPVLQTPFHLPLFQSIFLQKFKQKCSQR
jgi:hypothetical protein